MSHYSLAKLSDIALVLNGKTPSKKEQRNAGHPVLKIKDVSDNGVFIGDFDSFVDESFAEKFRTKQIEVGDTLILNAAHSADYVGSKVFYAQPDVQGSLATGEWLIIRSNKAIAYPLFIHYWVISRDINLRIRELVRGIHLYPRDVADIQLRLPHLAEQKRIATKLSKADRLRRLRRYALKLSDTFLQSVFLQMFGDPVTNPSGWNRATAADLGRVQTGNTPSRKNHEFYGNYIEWIKSDNIIEGYIKLTRSLEMLSEAGSEVGRIADVGSTLVTCIAGSVKSIGNPALADRRVAFNQQINSLTPRDGVNPYFLYGLFLTAKPLVQRTATASMKRIITKSKFEDLLLFKPPKSKQSMFVDVFNRYQVLRTQQYETHRQADHLFDTLLHRAFQGDV